MQAPQIPQAQDWSTQVEPIGRSARAASRQLAELTGERKAAALRRLAASLRQRRSDLIEANALDLRAAAEAGVAAPLVKRLELNDSRVASMAEAVEQIAAQTDPVGQVL